MSICIKANNIDYTKIYIDKKKKYDDEHQCLWCNIKYNYDTYIHDKLYILTDWVKIKQHYNKYDKIYFDIDNDDLLQLLHNIYSKVTYHEKTNSIDINDLIEFNNNTEIEELKKEDIKYYPLMFNYRSEITLLPSKKSGLDKYILNKFENRDEIKRYFPNINKNQDKFYIVGKFLIYITISKNGDNFIHNSFI